MHHAAGHPTWADTTSGPLPEPLLTPGYQDFSDLPAVRLRKGIDDEGNPWTPDILLCEGAAIPAKPEAWAGKTFGGAAFETDFSGKAPCLETYPLGAAQAPFWVLRIENLKATRKLLTVRLFIAPAGLEDEHLAWTPLDKFLFEIEPKQQAVCIRRAELRNALQAWSQRSYFDSYELPRLQAPASPASTWVFIAALITDAEIDHPENVCHCGSVQACDASPEALDRRDPRYPFNKVFKHSIRSTVPLLSGAGMRLLEIT